MSKCSSSNIALITLFAIVSLSFIDDLEYKTVAEGKLKILIPKDFVYKTSKVDDYFNPGNSQNAEIYANRDSSVEISFFLLPRDAYFSRMRGMSKMMSPIMSADTANGFKEIFNDTTTINNNKVYLFDFQSKSFGTKPQRIMMFIINADDRAIAGTISYDLKYDSQWTSESKKILYSIKLN